jgi:transposase InsO family protein
VRYANQLPQQVESLIVTLKRDKPHWGARKIREVLVRRLASHVRVPAKSTIHAVLDRHGLVKRMGKRRPHATGTPLSQGTAPNDLWSAYYKGEFLLGNRRWCYPLTVTDHASRFVLLCEALESTREDLAFTAFERLFAERGLPIAIRSDNGVPFASPNASFNLSKLSVWWLRLGIQIKRIKPGHPQQNGRHERMHLTLKKEATRPPGANSLQQQAKFDYFAREFNGERPHEALGMNCPAEIYIASRRAYRGLPDLTYPFHDRSIVVTACGRLCLHRKKINISTVFAGQTLGINKLTMAFGSSPSWIMISAISTWSRERCNPSTTLSARRLSLMSQIQRSEPGVPERALLCIVGMKRQSLGRAERSIPRSPQGRRLWRGGG